MMSSENNWDILLTKSLIRFVEISVNLLYNFNIMETFIVNAKDKAEFDFLSDLFKKLKINARVFSTEEKEDFALGEMMSKIDRSKRVSRDSVMAKLNKK